MSNKDVEKVFKFIFSLAVIVFCLVIIGFFLLAIKISLNFTDSVRILGVTMTN